MDPLIQDRYTVPGRHFSVLPGGKIRCEVCPRECVLSEGQRGLCFVRGNLGGKAVLASYGRSSGFCVDPIEKKPLNHFLPGTPIFSFGTAGCNLTCKFCQNWDISKSRETETLSDEASPSAIAAAAQKLGCRSVAFTYNDPTVFMEYALDCARAAQELGLKAVAVSAGYINPEARAEFYAGMDAANIDLKGFSEEFYSKICGASLKAVQATLVHVKKETRCWLEVTTLLIPGLNDSDDELKAQCDWMAKSLGPDTPLHFTAFHPDYKLMDRPATPASTLSRARALAQGAGLRYAYTGNVRDVEGGSTRCHACGALLIERDGYVLGHWGLDAAGRCAACGEALPGLLEAKPGSWGSRRLPVRMGA